MSTSNVSAPSTTFVPAKKRTATNHLVQSSRFASRLAKLLLIGLAVSVLAMAFLPWQQTSRGSGEVIAFDPQGRQQTVQATAKGVVERIAPGLVEGFEVEEGQFLLEIKPFAGDMVNQLNSKIVALDTKAETAKIKAEAYGLNVTGYTEALEFSVGMATEMVAAAQAKLESKQKQISAYEAKELQARLNYERQKMLWEKGLKPEKEIEKLKKEWDVTVAELESLHREVTSLEKVLVAKQNELQEKQRISQTKIESSRAMQQAALGEIATAQKEKADVLIKLKELERLVIKAPRAGTVFRLSVNERGDTVKEGDPLMIIVPKTSRKAVELLVAGNDMPLVQVGQEVRLQFEGWPAVQFTGWPSTAVGTFSGRVAIVDATDNGKGEFRILVTPNEDDDQDWPSDRYLRQGVRANGWVMLKEVRLGYEIWRQLNGFPVIVSENEPKKGSTKVPKLPK